MSNRSTASGLARVIPILDWLPGYSQDWLRADLAAGVTTAAVVIPQAMAYATIAGLPVEVGLYTALVPMLVYAILGTSRLLSVSVTSTISILTATQLALIVPTGDTLSYLRAASTLALLVGGFLVLAALLRLGYVANFISTPVLSGFKAGIGVVIFVGQLGKALGISVPKGPFFQTISQILQGLGETHRPTLVVTLVTLALLILLPRLTRRLSAPLVAVVLGILASVLLNLDAQGVELVGDISPGLPVPVLPDLSLVSALWPGALGIALMSFIESIAAARAFARQDDPNVSPDQELFALGAANLVGGFFQAYPAGGGTSQSAVNDSAGARSQMAGIITVASVALTLLFLAPLIGLMPQATLAALVLVAAAGLVKPDEFRAIAQIRILEFILAIIAFAGVVLLGTLEGILVAVLISLATLIRAANHPPVYAMGRKKDANVFRRLDEHPEDETFPGLLIARSEGRMYFANTPRVGEKLWDLIQDTQPRVLILECSAIPDFEYTALTMLSRFEERLSQQAITLWLVTLNPEALKVIERSPLGQRLGHERMFFNLESAVKAYQQNERDRSYKEQ